MSHVILHNYPQSPVAEKVRIGFGIKRLAWSSVEIPRLPPKDMLTKLTGGYRRTPVMQIGADIYCDSACILHELEQRFDAPSFFPTKNAGLMWALGRWTDGDLFDLAVKIVLGSAGENLPKDFAEDRGRLYLGANWAEGLKAANKEIPHLAAQMRAPMAWLSEQLADGRKFLLGSAPAAIDAQFYHIIWFLRGRWSQGPAFLSEFPLLEAWEHSVAEIGHGQSSDMSAEEAIQQAAKSEPLDVVHNGAHDPQGLSAGMTVIVSPDVDGGEQPVEGRLIAASSERITVRRSDPDAGNINVHFPRNGYRVTVLG
ncbi:MAG: glutathione S-transferase [Planktotalea sp.]|uniref:glutathione S-transferase family protein n=1 Tax=Planktotalea sp. TaxID=2029877 RepID=UPI003C706794